MTAEQAEFLKAACDNDSIPCGIHPTYSGRGMYGKTTVAISAPSLADLLGAVLNYTAQHDGLAVDWDYLRHDSLGFDVIIY